MKIDLNLLDNGLDFIIEGLKPTTRFGAGNNTASIWKYAILNVFSGIELILKHRLKQEHWSLIFEDVSHASESKLERGDFVSVNHSNIIKRLDRICNIKINDKPLDELRKLRNKFEHFEVKIEVHECKQVIANAMREVIVFWDKQISPSITQEQNQKIDLIKWMTFEFDTYAENMLQKHNSKISGILNNNLGILIHCNNCSNRSFMVYKEDRKFECFVCEYKITREKYLKGIREWELKRKSPETFSFVGDFEDYDYACFACKNPTRVRYQPSYFLSAGEYRPDYFFCVECLSYETQWDIDSRKFREELLELKKNHSPEEFFRIIEEKIARLEEEEPGASTNTL